MITGNPSDIQRECLFREIELGKTLGDKPHPNIVNFLGCITLSEPVTLIMEYLPHGDLLGYLRNSRRLKDKFYLAAEEIDVELTTYDLLSFAKQVASGMSFLASMKVSR